VRCAEAGSGVRRAMEPEWDVIRAGEGVPGEVGGRRVMELGKCEVWNVLWWRRRWPERDLGSALWIS